MLQLISKSYIINKIQIELLYIGETKNENLKDPKKLLDVYFSKLTSLENLPVILASIRTIFKNIEEKELSVNLHNQTRKIKIEFKDKKLANFKVQKKLQEDSNSFQIFMAKYEQQHGLKFNANEKKLRNQIFLKQMEETINLLTHIINDSKISLDGEKMLICQMYQLFYQEHPDFNLEETLIKFQIMGHILAFFDSTIMVHKFDWKKEQNIPVSKSLEFMTNTMIPLGKIEEIMDPQNYINPERIRLIGKIINETSNSLEDLKKISALMYIAKNNVKLEQNELMKETNCNLEELEKAEKLFRKIRIKIRDQKI